ncbi:MAG: Uma2 family endonuclease [Phycisphaerae bacterium]
MADATRTWTSAADFEEICEELGPSELVRSEVVRLSLGGLAHSRIVMRVAGRLWEWERRTDRGRVFTGETGLIVASDPDTVRGADVVFYSHDRLPKTAKVEGFSRTPPSLVVEVIGKVQGWGEMMEKAGEYLSMGVERVWVIDPETRRVHIFRSDAEPSALSADETLTDEHILPGFSCPVRGFFAD